MEVQPTALHTQHGHMTHTQYQKRGDPMRETRIPDHTLKYLPMYVMRPQPKRLALLHKSTLDTLGTSLMVRTDAAVGKSQSKCRRYVRANLRMFGTQTGMPLTAEMMLLTLEWMSGSAGPRSMLKYASTMAKLFPILKTTPEYAAWSSAVTIEAGQVPIRQVDALSKSQHRYFIAKYGNNYWAKWLSWKLNSRWGEIMALTKNDFIGPLLINGEISYAVNFAEKTKASKKRPYRPDMLVHLRDTTTDMNNFRTWISALKKYQHIATLTTTQVRLELQECFPDKHMGATSLKAGATTHLTKMAARGLIPTELVAQMAKHQGTIQKLPDTTVRYGRNKAALAIMMGSGAATVLL